MHAEAFVSALKQVPNSCRASEDAASILILLHNIRHDRRHLAQLGDISCSCVGGVARYTQLNIGTSWENIGFKYWSFQDFDVDGMRIIDYGNKE